MITQEYRNNRAHFPHGELAKYRGEWVAFSADGCRIVASAATVTQLEEQLQRSSQTLPRLSWNGCPAPPKIVCSAPENPCNAGFPYQTSS